MVESRYSGPRKDRNPFDQDDVDMGELFLDKQNITRFKNNIILVCKFLNAKI